MRFSSIAAIGTVHEFAEVLPVTADGAKVLPRYTPEGEWEYIAARCDCGWLGPVHAVTTQTAVYVQARDIVDDWYDDHLPVEVEKALAEMRAQVAAVAAELPPVPEDTSVESLEQWVGKVGDFASLSTKLLNRAKGLEFSLSRRRRQQ